MNSNVPAVEYESSCDGYNTSTVENPSQMQAASSAR